MKKTLFAVVLGTALWTTLAVLPPEARAQVCAKVYIEIEQEVTLERQAFDARMKINNGLTNLSVDDVAVEVVFQNAAGEPVIATSDPNDLAASFFITLDSLDGIGDVEGAGTIAPESSGEIHWLIIPAPGAAGPAKDGTLYFVGANVSYTIGGEQSEVAVVPDSIYVRPMPELWLDYFLPYDVNGDNPYTDEVEPPEPFPLGVRVANKGYGAAKNLKIESSQPKIVENELGLLIAFQIIGSEVQGETSTPSLLVDFGTIGAGAAKVARWLMTATLQGKFIEFSATFTHADELGGELTSLIEEVNTHTLIRDVLVDLPGRDTIIDFLAQDGTTLKVYESDLIDTEALDISSASSIAQSGATWVITVPPTAGFSYLEIPDPLFGAKDVLTAVRSDGKVLPSRNAWTSRHWIKLSQSYAHKINLFDTGNPLGLSYTLTLGKKVADNNAPVLGQTPFRKVRVGETLDYLVTATDPDGVIPTLGAAPLPAGAVFADSGDGSGHLVWTPGENQIGTYTVYFDASDGKESTSASAIIEVVPADTPNEAPTSVSAEIVTQRDTPSQPVTPTVVDPDIEDTHWFTLETAPAHGQVEITPSGQLIYMPDTGTVGPDSFQVRAHDPFDASVVGTVTVSVLGADDLVVHGLTLERDGAGVPVGAIVDVENTGTAATIQPVRIEVRAQGCGVDKTIGSVEAVLAAGQTPVHIVIDVSDPALADGAFALVATVDAAKELPEPDELDNSASVGVLLGAAQPAWLSLGTAGAEPRKVCAGATVSMHGRQSWGLGTAAETCHDVAAPGAGVAWSLAALPGGAALSSGEGRTDANGAWRLEVPMPPDAGQLVELTVTSTAGDVQDATKRKLVLVSCVAGTPTPEVEAPPYAGPAGGPAIVSFQDGGASTPWVVHPGATIPGTGPVGSGVAGGTSGTGSTDQVPLGGPPLGALGSAGQSGDPFDAGVVEGSLTATAPTLGADIEVGEVVTLTAVIRGNDSFYGLPVTWKVIDEGGAEATLAATTWYYLNGDLHVKATWAPPAAGAWTAVLGIGPGHQDEVASNDEAAIAIDVSKPAPMLAGLLLWLDAAQGVTTDGQGHVQAWADRSGLGSGAAQADAGLQPVLGTDALSGAAVVSCDGADDALELADGFPDFTAGLTTFVVAAPGADVGGGELLELSATATDRIVLGGAGTPDGLLWRVGSRTASATHGARLLELQALSVVQGTDVIATLRRDGMTVGSGKVRTPAPGVRTNNTLCGGAPGAFAGGIAEVLVYDRALSDAERHDVEVYLADRHGLYHPDATWIGAGGYDAAVVDAIHAGRWSKARADAMAAWAAAHPDTAVPGVGLRLWLRADAGVTESGGAVSAWADDAADPFADDATQADAPARPTWVTEGATSVLRFDGSDDGLRLPAGMAHLEGGLTTYVVAAATAETRWGSLVELTGDTPASRVALTREGMGAGFVLRSGASSLSGDGGLSSQHLRLLGAVLQPDGQASLLRAGEVVATGAVAVPRATVRDGSRLALSPVAGLEAFEGDIAEVLVWDRPLDAQERHAVEVYLADKYGLYHPDAAWLTDQTVSEAAADAAQTWGLGKDEALALDAAMTAHAGVPVPLAGMALWLDSADGVAATGGAVSGWSDGSPLGADAVQADGAKQPTLVDAAIGGRPAVSFDGVDDELTLPAGFGALDQGVTIVAVARPSRPTPGGALVHLGTPAVQHTVELAAASGPASLRYGAGLSGVEAPKGLVPGRFQIVAAVHDATGVSVERGGVQVASGALPLPPAVLRTANRVGSGAAPFTGELATLMVWSRPLTTGELDAVTLWLADRYGLFHPSAAWIASYPQDVVDRIVAERWSQAEADAWAAFGGPATDAGIPGAGIALWLRGEQAVAELDGSVGLWADLAPVPAPADASQIVEASRPSLLATVAAIGGAPAVHFDGVDDALELPAGFLDLQQGVTAFAVLRPSAGDRWGHLFDLSTKTGASTVSLARKGTTTTARWRSGAVAADGAGLLAGTSFRVLSVVHGTDGTVELRQHGIDDATATAPVPGLAWRDGARVGADATDAGHLAGDIAELLIYGRALDAVDRVAVEVYLADRYGLYHPDATWITGSGYDAGTIATIHAQRWSKAQADAAAP